VKTSTLISYEESISNDLMYLIQSTSITTQIMQVKM